MPSCGFTRDNAHLYRSCSRFLAVVGRCVRTSVWLTVREKGSGTLRRFRLDDRVGMCGDAGFRERRLESLKIVSYLAV